MRNFTKAAAIAAMIVAFGQAPAIAQSEPLSDAAIAAQCAAADAGSNVCSQLVLAKVTALRAQGLSPAQIDESMSSLVIALVEISPGNPALRATISQAISVAEANIADPTVRQNVAAINQAFVADDNIETAALGDAASPN